MSTMRDLIRFAAATLAALAIVIGTSAAPRAQAVPAIDKRITYILPQWLDFLTVDVGDIPAQVAQLRARIGEGPRVRVGFTTYIFVTMEPVDPADTNAVRAALAPTVARIDNAVARAVAANIPICLSFVTAVRESADPLQLAAQAEDRRNMQWHADNSLAAGWTTFSRYARKQEVIQEAYIREIGKVLASRMAAHPDILVAASGDGEIELSSDRALDTPPLIADYSPFAVAEFRDWLRGRGLYAPGQPFAAEAYASASRYASDASIATLNADFGQQFATWNLKYFDWQLSDPTTSDPHALPLDQYGAAPFAPAVTNDNGFDPPRVHMRGNAWSDLWDLFRATMVWRHNIEFAKWITTSADPATGATVPADRWFSDQIPGDYLFGGTPANPNGRLDTSASPIWTADVSPYGSLGITSFNVNFGELGFARTLAGAAPAIAARKVRWGIFEWNPSVGPTENLEIYRQEMALVEQYRPSLVAPFVWQTPPSLPYFVEGTGFEIALRELVTRLNNVPLTLSRSSLDIGATSTGPTATGSGRTPPQIVRVSGVSGESPAWSITSAPSYLDVVPAADGRSFSVELKPGTYSPGTIPGAIVVSPSEPGYAPATLNVTLRVAFAFASAPPGGIVESPAPNAIVSGEVPVTGWATDDIGLASVKVYREPVGAEQGLIPIGDATFIPGSRPDVQGAFPGQPQNDQAGWGYMLLTNMLPGGGNGAFTLVIVATDVDGHAVQIGTRRIVCQNSQSLLPFGTLDTPKQGETVSGPIVNFGWALTAQPNMIPPDGSTIDVLLDGVVVGHPTYGFARSDIQTLFPGYANTDGAVGYFVIDTTTMSNGLHTIAWIVRDNTGATQGIGSRFFSVANP
jgi:hypothetical protein